MPFQPEDSMEEIAKKLAEISLDSIRSTRESFHYGRMENIVRCIMKSSMVDVYGEGDSLYAAFEFKNKMMRIRRQVRIEMGVTQQSYQAINSDPNHCAILISHSGESRNVIRWAKALKKQDGAHYPDHLGGGVHAVYLRLLHCENRHKGEAESATEIDYLQLSDCRALCSGLPFLLHLCKKLL